MGDSWDGLEGVEATERVLHAAVTSGAREIHVSADTDGGTVFFISPNQIEFFAHVPCDCLEGIQNYLRTLAAIDSWKQAPATGFGLFACDGKDCQLEVQFVKGKSKDDVVIKITDRD